MVSAVEVDDPQIRASLISHNVGELTHVNDPAAIGRNLRVGGKLQVENVVDGQLVCLRQNRWQRNENQTKREETSCDQGAHKFLLVDGNKSMRDERKLTGFSTEG
jgi:hypothetical protein